MKDSKLADNAYKVLKEELILGKFLPGDKMTETALAERLKMSRTPIREALRRLEQERLIQESGKGSVVLGITVEDLMDIMDIRQRIEGLAAWHATKNMTPEGLERLRHINKLQDFYFHNEDVEHLRQMDDQFHDTIYELSGRTVICDTLLPLHRKTMRYRKISIQDHSRLDRSVQEHRDIFSAIEAGNAELAAELVTKHIANAKESMIARLK